MTDVKVFDFDDYKAYLLKIEQSRASIQRGFRSRLAEEIGCQNAFISQVLNTHGNFSLEQSFKISTFLNHGEEEKRYFLLMVEFARAGTRELQNHFRDQMNEVREKYLDIKGRVKSHFTLSPETQSHYYSHWHFAAIHVLVSIPEYRTIPKIAESLGLEISIVQKAVLFLVSAGLLVEKGGVLTQGPSQLHLGKDSPNIAKHHSNWRIAAIRSLASESPSDIHYSTVSSLAVKDVEVIRGRLIQNIQDYVETIKPSKEETIYSFNLDFFRLIR